jgi:hypothetical protein
MYDQTRADLAPWREAGANALKTLQDKINAGPGEFEKSPGYDFRLSEGTKALERGAAAKGGLLSGGASKALVRYGQDYATNDYDNFLARYYQSLSPLQNLSASGGNAAAQTGQAAIQTGQSIGQNTIAAGNAQAGGAINHANAITGGINSGVNNYLMWKYLNK